MLYFLSIYDRIKYSVLFGGNYMKNVLTDDLRPGMIVAKDIYLYNDTLFLGEGAMLTDKIISSLYIHSVISVYIKEDKNKISLDQSERPTDYFTRVREQTEFREFQQKFEINAFHLKREINNAVKNNASLNLDMLYDYSNTLIQNNHLKSSMFDMLHNMRNYDDTTYIHSLNVSLICNIFGQWLDLNEYDLQTLTLSGLLHDIGKLRIPDQIIKKPGKLTQTEYDIIKTHTTNGYKILKNHDIDRRIINATLMHHERMDGTGYPFHLDGTSIQDFAKIVSIADVYDAMTSSRIYRGPLCPFKVLSIMEQEGMQKYDPKYFLIFMEYIGSTYLHTSVLLSDGRVGEVVFINSNTPSRPLVKIGNTCIDLSKTSDITIEKIL